jgi:hypothetical protein
MKIRFFSVNYFISFFSPSSHSHGNSCDGSVGSRNLWEDKHNIKREKKNEK